VDVLSAYLDLEGKLIALEARRWGPYLLESFKDSLKWVKAPSTVRFAIDYLADERHFDNLGRE